MKSTLKFFTDNKIKIILLLFLLTFSLISSLNIVSAESNNTKILFDETGPYLGKFFTIHNMGTYGSSGFATLLGEQVIVFPR